jgi:hypothetical protein
MSDDKWRWPWAVCVICGRATNRNLRVDLKDKYICNTCAISNVSYKIRRLGEAVEKQNKLTVELIGNLREWIEGEDEQ